ncbi:MULTISPECIES: GNAT family protein [unclassified Leptolyngbya]|uniref:GNAT family N-acetyltransferase n=1 Tax=unclassified Leptolyngbya TaxID=2650499 RepID=UPI0016854F22|nr:MULTISPECIES: GNAT family protein [unclassified Leptolyngbya]MBD1910431.1 GNAT family N-acetyltransferase [Leptolyngbya sp. FACHB-8]MBD2154200.1 GNAT family N-acetyltransferase [Leptolyngbya sp. FACHB-16]
MSLRFETERLILRPFEMRDAEHFAAYRSDLAIARYQYWHPPLPLADAIRFVKTMQALQPGTPGEWYQIAIQPRHLNHLVGDCAFCVLSEDVRQAEFGITLAGEYQKQGYAGEAIARLFRYLFSDLNLHRVRAICHVDNHPSARLLERLGMRREAHFIDYYWFKDRWVSEYWYGLLRSEWESSL